MNNLTQEYLKETLDYSPATGIFTWKIRPRNHFTTERGWKAFNTQLSNKPAGNINNQGYLRIKISGKTYQGHRLAWLYIHGTWPVDQIDHISHEKLDNRISNLREATGSENHRNTSMQKRNKSGFTGVVWNKACSKWKAQASINGEVKFFGLFSDIKDAIAARKSANIKYNFHKNHGGLEQ